MTLTFIDLYNECAGQPWSMFDAEAESQDDFETALKISINKAISYLWGLGEVSVVSAYNLDYSNEEEVNNKIKQAINEGLEIAKEF
jgi:hypothetical protein